MPSPRANASSLITLFSKFNLTPSAKQGASPSSSGSTTSRGRAAPTPPLTPNTATNSPVSAPRRRRGGGDLSATSEKFDNQYFKDLVKGREFLNSDQTLYTSREPRGYVKMFSKNEEEFFRAFVEGMIKMGDLQSHLGGEIRRNCRVVNGNGSRPVQLLPK